MGEAGSLSPVALERPVVRQNTAAQVLLNTPRWLPALPGRKFVYSQSTGCSPSDAGTANDFSLRSNDVAARARAWKNRFRVLALARAASTRLLDMAARGSPFAAGPKSLKIGECARPSIQWKPGMEWKSKALDVPNPKRCARPAPTRNRPETAFTTLTISCALLPFQCDLGSLPVLWIDGGGYQI